MYYFKKNWKCIHSSYISTFSYISWISFKLVFIKKNNNNIENHFLSFSKREEEYGAPSLQ